MFLNDTAHFHNSQQVNFAHLWESAHHRQESHSVMHHTACSEHGTSCRQMLPVRSVIKIEGKTGLRHRAAGGLEAVDKAGGIFHVAQKGQEKEQKREGDINQVLNRFQNKIGSD